MDTYNKQMKYFVEHKKENTLEFNTFADSIEVLKTCLNG